MTPGKVSPSGDRQLQGRFRFSAAILPDLVAALDVVLIVAAAIAPYAVYVTYHAGFIEYYVFCVGFIAVASVVLLGRAGMYEPSAIMRPVAKSDIVIVSIGSAFLFFLTIAFSLKVSELYSRVWIYLFAGSSVFLVLTGRFVICRVLRRLTERRIVGRNLVVFGQDPQLERFLARFARRRPDLTGILGVFVADGSGAALPERVAGFPVTGGEAGLVGFLRENQVEDVVIAMPWDGEGRLEAIIDTLKELPLNVYLASQFIDYQLRFKPTFGYPRELPLFEVVARPISGWSSLVKTLEDYVIATLLLVVLSPLLALVALAIRLDSAGPVFFMQRRLGFNNREFRIYKFRSMYHREVPEDRVRQASRGDPRVTRVGRFIRSTSIDELPQLFNVLDGTMSLVGPRPHAISHNEDYGRQIRGYFARHKVKPGITGWAQINNLRGETETVEKMAARVDFDIYYVENWSLLFDLRILFVTPFVVLFQKSAY